MEDERYFITPKGLASLAMLRTGLIESIDDPRLEGFWELFESSMYKAGYIEDVDETEDE